MPKSIWGRQKYGVDISHPGERSAHGQTIGDELEHDPPRGGHALMELGDLEMNDETAADVGIDAIASGVEKGDSGAFHLYVVRGRSTAK